jgi:hypothetical protein
MPSHPERIRGQQELLQVYQSIGCLACFSFLLLMEADTFQPAEKRNGKRIESSLAGDNLSTNVLFPQGR